VVVQSAFPVGMTLNGLADLHRGLREQGPVREVPGPDGVPVWIVTGFSEIVRLLTDTRVVNKGPGSGVGDPGFGLPKALATNLLNMGAADHHRVRTMASPGFARCRGEASRAAVETHVRDLLDVVEASGDAEVDFYARLAAPLQARVIRDLLGVFPEDAATFEAAAVTVAAFDPGDPSTRDGMVPATHAIVDCLARLLAARRAKPGDDLVSEWFTAGMTDAEALSLAFLVVLASQNSVGQNANALGVLAARDRAEVLADVAVEERWQAGLPGLLADSLVGSYAVRRFNLDEITLGGVTVPAGSPLFVSLRAAISDPARSCDRSGLAFGRGAHYCLAAELATVELDVLARAVFRRFPGLRSAQDWERVEMRATWRTHSPRQLQILPYG